MKRTIEKKLLTWKSRTEHKPLILRGARQVGKTYTVKNFAKTHFENFAYFDFQEQRSIHKIFDGDLTASSLIIQIEALSGTRVTEGDTLLFFDEIQECPRALMSLRYFYEQKPQLHVIAAGSLLEFSLSTSSFPVGRVEFEWMFPLGFKEFLIGTGQKILSEHVPDLSSRARIPSSIHEKLIEQLRTYFVVGGMPEAVVRFSETGSMVEVNEVHKRLLLSYKHDIPRYSRRADVNILEQLFDSIPRSIGKQVKYSVLNPEGRIEKTKAALRVLECSLLVQKVMENSALGLPLGANIKDHRFKLIMLDIGLVQYLCGVSPLEILQGRNLLDIYRGALAEQFVGQQLVCTGAGSESGKLYYWAREARGSSAETDYVIVRNGKIHPLEVKSGIAGKLKSLHLFMNEHPNTAEGIVMSMAEYREEPEYGIRRLPLYTDLT